MDQGSKFRFLDQEIRSPTFGLIDDGMTRLLVVLTAGGRGLTCRRDDHFGPAAGEAVQQRFGPDVEVEQSSQAAQLGQTEPGPHEAGLVGQEEGDRVPLLQPGCSLQSSGHLVALSVHMSVRIFPTLEEQEGLRGMLLRGIQEAVHDAVERRAPLVPDEPDAEHDAPQDVHAVVEEMREKFPEKRRQRNRKSGENAEPQIHVGATEETCVRRSGRAKGGSRDQLGQSSAPQIGAAPWA